LNPTVVAHLEYFHNTLNAEHASHPNHENPFKNLEEYPALTYVAKMDVLDSIQESNTENNSDDENLVDRDEIKHKPQIMVTNESATNNEIILDPKLFMTPEQNKARKCSIRMELKKQGEDFVRRLSVFDKHQLLINPNAFENKLAEAVKNDKSSILS
jgi:hypothetical protein